MKSPSSVMFSQLWWDIAVELCPPIQYNGQWISIINQLYHEFGSTIVLASLQSLYAKKRCALSEQPINNFTAYLHAICNNKRQEQQSIAKNQSRINTQSFNFL